MGKISILDKISFYQHLSFKKILKSEIFWLTLLSFSFYFFLLNLCSHLLDNDIYFHLKIAQLLREKIIIFTLPQEAFSIHADRNVDFHFLFHWFLVPFTFFSKDGVISAKVAIAFFSTFSVLMLYVLLKELKVLYVKFWILFYLISSPIFTGRLLFGRGITLFIGIIFLYIYFLIKRKHIALFVICWISVWTYPGFPILIIFVFVYTFSDFFSNTGNFESNIKCLLFSMYGIIAGIIIHPSFPAQFYGYYLELLLQFFKPSDIESIAEWLPPEQSVIKPALTIPVLLLFFRFIIIKKHTSIESTLLIFIFLLIISLTWAIKPFEYFIPFLVIYLALNDWNEYPVIIKNFLFFIIILLFLLWSMPQLYLRLQNQIRVSNPEADFDAADWLALNSEKNELVLLSWGEFPKFFYKNDKNRYLFGLNPVYSYGYDRGKYLLIKNFFSESLENPKAVPEILKAKYAVLDNNLNKGTIFMLQKDFKPVFINAKYTIFKF